MTSGGPAIVPLEARHVEAAASLHLNAFPGFFLSFLGRGFLVEFYRAFLNEPGALAFVAEDEGGRLCGVVVGTATPRRFFQRLLRRRWWAFALASGAALARRPGIAGRLLRAVVYRGEAPADVSRALLSSVAVDPASQGTGIGRRLVDCWLAQARRQGVAGCYLTTDAHGNEAVNAFYQRCGWKLEGSYPTPQGRLMNRYIYDFARVPTDDRAYSQPE